MQIAILGGTGDIGEGLALRIARDTDHSVIIGSRKERKAEDKAAEYTDRLEEHGSSVTVDGFHNEAAAENGDIVIAGIPPQYIRSMVESLDSILTTDKILVSPAVVMKRDESGFHYDPPGEGSITTALQSAVSDDVPVIGAFQNLAAGALSNLSVDVSADVVVTGDDAEAKSAVINLAAEVEGLRPLDGGALANSAEVESLTPLLINLAMNNEGMHDLGVRFK